MSDWLAQLKRDEANGLDRAALVRLFPDWHTWIYIADDLRPVAGVIARNSSKEHDSGRDAE